MVNNVKRTVTKLVRLYESNDPFRISRHMGIKIMNTPMESIRGVFYSVQRVPIMLLSSDLDESSRRIVCAHELGHYAMGHFDNRMFLSLHTNIRLNKFEIEADTFAAELLIPDDEFHEMLEQNYSIEQIAYHAAVPLYFVTLKMT